MGAPLSAPDEEPVFLRDWRRAHDLLGQDPWSLGQDPFIEQRVLQRQVDSVTWLGRVVRSTEGGEPCSALLRSHWHELAPSEAENKAPDFAFPLSNCRRMFWLEEVIGSAERQRGETSWSPSSGWSSSGQSWGEASCTSAPPATALASVRWWRPLQGPEGGREILLPLMS